MKKNIIALAYFFVSGLTINAQRIMENIDRGVVAVHSSKDSVFISWRMLNSDPGDIAFDIYKISGQGSPKKLNDLPISKGTFFIDAQSGEPKDVTYIVCNSGDNNPVRSPFNSYTLTVAKGMDPYISVPIQIPPPGYIDGKEYTYSANDISVGDLDGDGKYEIVLKWEPSITRNPPQKGLTGEQIIDAYRMDGTRLWRINLGKNVRAGAAYNPFLVYDLDGDGRSEMVCRTADGSIDGKGQVIGTEGKDWRTLDPDSPTYGKIVDGPEYITVFDGVTGKALTTETFIPTRYPLDGWGGVGGNGRNDNTAGRSDRFLAAVAYLDGIKPSFVFVRGIYGRTVVAAWDYRVGKLTSRWVFDSKNANNPFSGQGNHNLTVADVDGDGKDEICVGAMTVNDDGKGLYSTGLRHGDAVHIADMDTGRPGLEVFGVHENEGRTISLQTPGVALFDARNGDIIFSLGPGVDVGRGVAADIDPIHPGFENWGGPGGLRDVHGNTISNQTPSSANFVIWWDGDLTRELLDRNRIDKWDWENETTRNLLTATDCQSNNGSKATPCLSADLLGDWREEVIWRTKGNTELRVYTTAIPTPYRFCALMQDRQYRLSIVWQNVAYNQPPHLSFDLGSQAR